MKSLLILMAFAWLVEAQTPAIVVTSPANGSTVTGTVQLMATITNATATEHVDWYVDGEFRARSHKFNDPCGGYEDCPGPGFSAQYATTDGGDMAQAKVYAVAKDVFGNTLATSATNTFAIRNLGALVTITPPSSPWTGDVSSPIYVQGVFTGLGGAGSILLLTPVSCGVDGMPNAASDNGYMTQYGGNLIVHTARFPNGIHDVHCNIIGQGTAATASFAPASVNTSTSAITIPSHPYLTGTAGDNPLGLVYTTTGTTMAGLTAGATYYPAVIDANTIKLASSASNASSCASSGLNCVTLSSQGTGTHTFSWRLISPYYGQDGCPNSCSWTAAQSNYRTQIDFENGSAAMELRMPEEIVLYQDLGPANFTSAPYVQNCDASTTSIAANAVSYVSSNTAVAVVSSTGVVTAVAPGFADITSTYSTLPPVVSHVSVYATTQFLHLSRSGQVLTNYTPGQSEYANSVFQVPAFQYDGFVPGMCNEWQWSGNIGGEEGGIIYNALQVATTSYANGLSTWNSVWPQIQADEARCNHGSFFNWQLVNIMAYLLGIYNNLGWPNTPGQTRLDLAHTIMNNIVADARTRLIYFGDEISNEWQGDPAPNNTISSAAGAQFSQIVVTGCPGPCSGPGVGTVFYEGPANPPTWMKLTNCTTANLCGPYTVQTPTTPSTKTTGFSSSFTITTHNVANGTYNASTDPGMKLVHWPYLAFYGERYVVPGGQASEATQQNWSSSLTQISVASNGLATVTWTGCCGTDAAAITTGRIVWGHSASNAALNDVFAITRVDNDHFTMQTYNLAAGVYNATTDPNLFFSVDGLTDGNVLKNVKGQLMNVPGAPVVSWPILGLLYGNSNTAAIVNAYENNPSMASASMVYSRGQPFPSFGDRLSPMDSIADKVSTLIQARGTWMEPSVHLTLLAPVQYEKYSPCLRFTPGIDLIQTARFNASAVTTNQAFVTAKGAIGKRAYHLGIMGPNTSDLCGRAPGQGIDQGPDPFTGWTSFWGAMALENNLDNRVIKYMFQPMINSPGYGPFFFTGARGGANGKILMVGSLSTTARSQTIDFTPYRYAGGLIRRYRLTERGLSVLSLSGAANSDVPTFGPAEVIYYVFQPSGSFVETTPVQFPAPVSFPAGTSKMAIKTGYYHNLTDLDAIDCTAGCAPEMDLHSSDVWFQRIYLDSNNVVKIVGDQQVLRHQ